jgi:hypothetical protein
MSMPGDRNHALDFTKGALVILMVVYHWLNYFVPVDQQVYNYLRFITPSFIFIAGFLVGNLYSTKGGRVSSRLAIRGLKLLLFFTLINVAAGLLLAEGRTLGEGDSGAILANAFSVYVSGNGKYAAFQVLVPIAYLLIVASALLITNKWYVPLLIICCAASGAMVVAMAVNGEWSFNLELLSFGLLGALVGHIPLQRINRLPSYGWAVAMAYAGYLAMVTVVGVPYWLQIFGVILSLVLIYCLGLKVQDHGALTKHIILLGKYTLLGYVAQIAILRVVKKTFMHLTLDNSALALIITCGLTSAVILIVDRARANWTLADRSYRLVFA